jgi:hypothetical protein
LTACGRERLELRARASVEPSRPKITGLQAWQELAPFRVRVHPCAQVDLAIEADVTADGDVALPPLPPGAPCAELLDKAGATLHGWTYLQTNGESPVPPPQQLPLLAVDADGKPVAGARILHRSADLRRWDGGFLSTGPRERWRLVATTGADGKATALLPLAADPTQPDQKPDSLVLLAQQDGCADSHSGFEDGWFVDGKKLAEQPQRLRCRASWRAANPSG